MAEGAQHFLDSFKDPEAVARYTEGPRRFVPGLDGLHRMTGLLLAERVPENADLLVLGAGGGSEMQAMAEAHPGWRFTSSTPQNASPPPPKSASASTPARPSASRPAAFRRTRGHPPAGSPRPPHFHTPSAHTP